MDVKLAGFFILSLKFSFSNYYVYLFNNFPLTYLMYNPRVAAPYCFFFCFFAPVSTFVPPALELIFRRRSCEISCAVR